MYKVYEINPKCYYHGKGLVAAESAIEANKLIDNFIAGDPDNAYDSWGYEHVEEWDCIESLQSNEKGIVLFGIYYNG